MYKFHLKTRKIIPTTLTRMLRRSIHDFLKQIHSHKWHEPLTATIKFKASCVTCEGHFLDTSGEKKKNIIDGIPTDNDDES